MPKPSQRSLQGGAIDRVAAKLGTAEIFEHRAPLIEVT
jgi:hypothetical protein